jgi:hypothetical protein
MIAVILSLCLTGSADVPTRSVLVVRHCARATALTFKTGEGAIGFNFYDNYTTLPFPRWPSNTLPEKCLVRGNTLVKNFSSLVASTLPQPVSVFADACDRDKSTAADILSGLSMDPANYTVASKYFYPKFCPMPSAVKELVAIKSKLAVFPPPANLEHLLTALQNEILGKGVAPSLLSIKNPVLDPTGKYHAGGVLVGASLVEAFLMQQGNGSEVAWGRISPEKLNSYLALNVYGRAIEARLPLMARASHSNMLVAVATHLKGGSTNDTAATKIFVGHDDDLDALAALLGLSWEAVPYPANTTTPGSALRFDFDEASGSVSMSLEYTTLDGAALARSVPATFPGGNNTLSAADFQAAVRGAIDPACVDPDLPPP